MLKRFLTILILSFIIAVPAQAHDTIVKDNKGSDILFVGDSRAVGMMQSEKGSDISYIAKTGAGYKWFKETAVNEIESFKERDMTLIINMGVNDLDDKEQYTKLINDNIGHWEEEGFTVCFASVNPVIEGKHNATENKVKAFNAYLKKNLWDIWYMDSYTYLKNDGFSSPDGLHYSKATYRDLAGYYREYVSRIREES